MKKTGKYNYISDKESSQLKSDKKLLKRLKVGHRDAKKMKGKFV